MYSYDLMLQCLSQIKGNIVLPDKGFFNRKENGITMLYFVDGQQVSINLPNREAAAHYLKENGIVDSFKTIDGEVKLFRNSYYYTTDHQMKPIMIAKPNLVAWEDIKLTKTDVRNLASRDIFNKAILGKSSYGNTYYHAPISNKKYDA